MTKGSKEGGAHIAAGDHERRALGRELCEVGIDRLELRILAAEAADVTLMSPVEGWGGGGERRPWNEGDGWRDAWRWVETRGDTWR